MNLKKSFWSVLLFVCVGCAHGSADNTANLQTYSAPTIEAGWIRDGNPIVYEAHQWYPINDVEVLMDSEVYQVTEYKGVQVFVDKLDTKPYKRLYTKFSKNKFRYFEQKSND